MLPGSSPCGPSPIRCKFGKVIAERLCASVLRNVESGNLHDTRVIPVSLEQFRAKLEKCRIGQTIVFEDDGFFHVREGPPDPRGHTLSAAQITVGGVPVDLTIPVDAIDVGSSLGTARNIIGTVWTRSVGDDVQLLRLDFRNLRKHSGGRVRSVKKIQYDRYA